MERQSSCKSSQASDDGRKRTVLFDTDPGVDDALALLYLHRRPDVELAGITTVAGNAAIDVVTRNALFLVERFGIAVPVARGAAAPLVKAFRAPPAHIHGENALGDIAIGDIAGDAMDSRPAHRFIIDTIRQRPHQVTLLAVGMLTNLALALAGDAGIASLVREVVVMGGAFGTGGRYGNVQPAAEANVFGDPHAADIVFGAPWPVTIVGLDVTERVVMTPEYLAGLRDAGTPEGRLIWEITRGYEAFHARRDGLRGIYAHDPSAAVCAVDASPFGLRTGPVRVAVDGVAAGVTLQKPVGREFPPSPWDAAPDQRVAVDVDAGAVLAQFAAPFAPREGRNLR